MNRPQSLPTPNESITLPEVFSLPNSDKFFQTERANTRSFEIVPQKIYRPQVDLRLSSALQNGVVPIVPKPIENQQIKYQEFQNPMDTPLFFSSGDVHISYPSFNKETNFIIHNKQPKIRDYTSDFDYTSREIRQARNNNYGVKTSTGFENNTNTASGNPTLIQPVKGKYLSSTVPIPVYPPERTMYQPKVNFQERTLPGNFKPTVANVQRDVESRVENMPTVSSNGRVFNSSESIVANIPTVSSNGRVFNSSESIVANMPTASSSGRVFNSREAIVANMPTASSSGRVFTSISYPNDSTSNHRSASGYSSAKAEQLAAIQMNPLVERDYYQPMIQLNSLERTLESPINTPVVIKPVNQPIQSGSIDSYNPLPPGNRYLERTTNSTTYPTDVKKHYINVDTRFRNNPNSTSSTNFRWKLFRPIKNAISIRVASIEIPNNFYVFSVYKKNIEFSVKLSTDPSYTTLRLIEGNYTSSEMVNELQTLLQDIDSNFTVELSYITGKLVIKNIVNTFDIKFPKDENTQTFGWGLGFYLGFLNTEYLNQTSLVAERVINLLGDNYIFLQIGDYEGVQHEVEKQGLINATAKIILTSDKYQVLFDNGSNFISKEVCFPMPQNISAFNVRLLDSANKDIEMEGTNYSFTIEIAEIVNSRLYSAYSDNLLQNSETPR